MGEVIIELIVLAVFAIPGAFFRWLFLFRKRKFKDVLQDDGYINGMIGLMVTGLIYLYLSIFFNCQRFNVL